MHKRTGLWHHRDITFADQSGQQFCRRVLLVRNDGFPRFSEEEDGTGICELEIKEAKTCTTNAGSLMDYHKLGLHWGKIFKKVLLKICTWKFVLCERRALNKKNECARYTTTIME